MVQFEPPWWKSLGPIEIMKRGTHPVHKPIVFSAIILAVAGVIIAGAFSKVAHAADSSDYHLVKTVPVSGEGGWDYLTIDSSARRLYISRGTHVAVMDTDTYAVVGDIPDTQGVHGIALAPDLGRGFTSNGRSNTVTVFDLKTLATLATATTGDGPDAIVYDPASKRVFTFNGRAGTATAIDAEKAGTRGVSGLTINLGGKPEFAVADGEGHIYNNLEDKSLVLQIDSRTREILNRWPLQPCESPSGMAIDTQHRRLFIGCHNRLMAIMDADTGKVVATVPIGEGVDANSFDPSAQLAFASNGDGTLTVVHEDSPDKYTVVKDVATRKSARTMALDPKTHNIFLPAADFGAPTPGQHWPSVKPGTFVILVFGK
jgi:DNA-binding beta-propeller fold protein YncE